MNNFETTILISPDTTENNLNGISEEIEKLVTNHGGSIIGNENWGLRDLSYNINGVKKAFLP